MWEPRRLVATLQALSLLPQPPHVCREPLGKRRPCPVPPDATSLPSRPPPGLPVSFPVACCNSFCSQQVRWRQTLLAFFPLRMDFTLFTKDIVTRYRILGRQPVFPRTQQYATSSGLCGFRREACVPTTVPRSGAVFFLTVFKTFFPSSFSLLAGRV